MQAAVTATFRAPNFKVMHNTKGVKRWDIPREIAPDQAKTGEESERRVLPSVGINYMMKI